MRLQLELGDHHETNPEDLAAAQALIDSVRSRIPSEELGSWGELIPSRRRMAREAAPDAEFDRPYGRMSHMAHPGLISGFGKLRLVDEHGRVIWEPPSEPTAKMAVLAQAAHSSGRCVRRLAPSLRVEVEQRARAILVMVDGIAQSEIAP